MKTFSKTYFEILFILGLLLSILVAFDRGYDFFPDFISGMFTSMSIVLIVIAGIVKHSRILQAKLQISSTDERLQAIEGRASVITLYEIMIVNVICIVTFGFFGEPYLYISLVLALIMLIAIIILLITKLVLTKKM